jgi:hypothetical protein
VQGFTSNHQDLQINRHSAFSSTFLLVLAGLPMARNDELRWARTRGTYGY